MAHNVMRVDSTNDRYVTETMIDLNLNLNEEIDFDFFDNIGTPSKELEPKKNNKLAASQPRLCSPQFLEDDDDDVQVNLHSYTQGLCDGTIKDINASSDSIDEPLSTGTDNDDRFIDNFGECEPSKNSNNLNVKLCDNVKEVVLIASCPSGTEISSQELFSQTEKTLDEAVLSKPYSSLVNDVLSNESFKSNDDPVGNIFSKDNKENDASSRKSSLHQASNKSSESLSEDILSESRFDPVLMKSRGNLTQDDTISNSKESDDGAMKSSANHEEDVLSKSSLSQKAEGSGSGYDSDEGCPFEGSDSDELLLGVHTLTIIPRDNDEESLPCTPICEQLGGAKENEMIHPASSEMAAITARSSSGYSSASCKAHGCILSSGNNAKAGSRQSSKMKMSTPDMDEFIKSFRKMQSSPQVSLPDKYSTSKKQTRRNMSFSNEEFKRIERENAILLNKIVLQQRSRPTIVHKYERRITSNAINRARQSRKIEYDNEILLKKIQDVKRKSTLSAQSSRCISQASTSQL